MSENVNAIENEVMETENTEVVTSGYVHVEPVDGDNQPEIESTTTTDDTTAVGEVIKQKMFENDLVDESNYDQFKFLGLKQKRDDVKTMMDDVKTKQNKFFKDEDNEDEIGQHLDEAVADMTPEQISKLTNDEVREIYTYNGEEIGLNIPFDNEKDRINFLRDFLKLRKEGDIILEKCNKELEQIDAEIAANQEEFNKVVGEFQDMNKLILHTLEDKRDKAETDEKRELYNGLITAYTNGFSLDNVKEYFSNRNKVRNILSEYRSDKKAGYIHRRYMKVCKSLEIKQSLTEFVGIERKFLPPGYNRHPNIFMFSVISMISSYWGKPYDKALGVFITQFAVNMKNLILDKFSTMEEKCDFVDNIVAIMDMIDPVPADFVATPEVEPAPVLVTESEEETTAETAETVE